MATWSLNVAAVVFAVLALLFFATMWIRDTVRVEADGTLTVRWLRTHSMVLTARTTCDVVDYDLGFSGWFDMGAKVLIVDNDVEDPVHIPGFLAGADLNVISQELASTVRERRNLGSS